MLSLQAVAKARPERPPGSKCLEVLRTRESIDHFAECAEWQSPQSPRASAKPRLPPLKVVCRLCVICFAMGPMRLTWHPTGPLCVVLPSLLSPHAPFPACERQAGLSKLQRIKVVQMIKKQRTNKKIKENRRKSRNGQRIRVHRIFGKRLEQSCSRICSRISCAASRGDTATVTSATNSLLGSVPNQTNKISSENVTLNIEPDCLQLLVSTDHSATP